MRGRRQLLVNQKRPHSCTADKTHYRILGTTAWPDSDRGCWTSGLMASSSSLCFSILYQPTRSQPLSGWRETCSNRCKPFSHTILYGPIHHRRKTHGQNKTFITTQDALNMNQLAQKFAGDLASHQVDEQHMDTGITNNHNLAQHEHAAGPVVIIDEPFELNEHQNPGTPTPRPPTPPTLSPLIGSVPTTIGYTPETIDLLAPGEDLNAAAGEALELLQEAEQSGPPANRDVYHEQGSPSLFRVPGQDVHPT